MERLRYSQAVVVAALLTIAGCHSHPNVETRPAPGANATKESKAGGADGSPTKSNADAKPLMFGFEVTNISPELCCSDTPGPPKPTGDTTVEGLTPDNVRFLLSCLPVSYADYNKSPGKISKAVRDKWYDGHTASVKSGQYEDQMTIYNFDGPPPDYWKEFAECSVLARIDRAQNEFPVRVSSSRAGDWKGDSGFEVTANSNSEALTLRCLQKVQSPCVSVAPDTYRGIRDGSELRLYDPNLKVVATFQIVGETSLR